MYGVTPSDEKARKLAYIDKELRREDRNVLIFPTNDLFALKKRLLKKEKDDGHKATGAT